MTVKNTSSGKQVHVTTHPCFILRWKPKTFCSPSGVKIWAYKGKGRGGSPQTPLLHP